MTEILNQPIFWIVALSLAIAYLGLRKFVIWCAEPFKNRPES